MTSPSQSWPQWLRTKVGRYFRELENSRPIPFAIAVSLRSYVLLVIAIASICVLSSGLPLILQHLGLSSHFRHLTLGPLFMFFLVLSVTGAHLFYLCLVFQLLILNSPPEKLYRQQFVIPTLIVGAYLLYAAQGLCLVLTSFNPPTWLTAERSTTILATSGFASYLLFLLAYLFWFCRDACEYYDKRDNLRRRLEVRIWWASELIAIVFLAVALYSSKDWSYPRFLERENIWYYLFFGKNGPIIMCLVVYGFLRTLGREWKQSRYKQIYSDYLKHTRALAPAISLPSSEKEGIKRVLDYGCANGKRLTETLQQLDLLADAKAGKIKITGFDSDDSWKDSFDERFSHNGDAFQSKEEKLTPNEYDLILFSHLLYGQQAVRQIGNFINRCKGGAYIVVRGASPNSFFFAVSMAFSLRNLSPTKSHLWINEFLPHLRDEANLEPVNSNGDHHPLLTIPQTYKITVQSIKNAEELIGYLYGAEVGKRLSDYWENLLNHHPEITEIPNDDSLFLYRTRK